MSKPVGRPPMYKTAEELQIKCDEYFKVCDDKVKTIVKGKVGKQTTIIVSDPEPYTVPGLAHYLGFESRFSIIDYKHKKKFSHTIKQSLGRIESQRVSKALQGRQNPVFSMFDLKNNFKYVDKIETEISGPGGGPIALTAIPPTPQSLAQWEAMMIESRKKAKQIAEKT